MDNLFWEQVVKDITVHKTVIRKSGGTCDSYINGKYLVLRPDTLLFCAKAFLDIAHSLNVTHVGGEVASALPLVGSIVALSDQTHKKVHGFFIREAIKPYGIHEMVEGQFEPGARLLVIDDVVGTGSVALRSCRILQEKQYNIAGFCAIIDRNEGARQKIEAKGIAFHALYTLEKA